MSLLFLCLLSTSAQAAPLSLLMDPLIHGYPVDIEVHGAAPGALVQVVRSDGVPGTGVSLPNGDTLQITRGSGYRRILLARADASGSARWSVDALSASVPEGTFAFQAVVLAGNNSAASNPLRRSVLPTPPGHVDDLLEPDSTRGSATVLETGIVDARLCPGDTDWFRIDLDPGEAATAYFVADQRLELQPVFLDVHDTPLGSTIGGRGASGITWHNTNLGQTPVWFQARRTGGVSCEPYEVWVQTGPAHAPCSDPGDGANTQATATSATIGQPIDGRWCPGDVDWVALQPPTGELVIEGSSPQGDVALTLWGPDGEIPLLADRDPATPQATRAPVESGTPYLLRIDGRDDALGGGLDYSIDTRVRAAACPSQLGTADEPYPLTLGTNAIRVCPDSDTIGWFAVPNAPDRLISLSQQATETVESTLSSQGVELDRATVLEPTTTTLPADGYRPWTLQVDATETTGDPMLLWFGVDHIAPAEPCTQDAFEPNGSETAATPLLVGQPRAATSCLGDIDVYRTDLLAGETITFDVQWNDPNADRPYTVSGLVNPRLAQGPLTLSTATDGTVYLYVNGTEREADYVVVASTQSPQQSWEPNNTPGLATNLRSGQWISSISTLDDDWYVLASATGDSVSFLNGPCVDVIDGMGTLLSATCNDVTVTALGPTLFRIPPSSTPTPYEFFVTAEDRGCRPDVHEPDDSTTEATSITPGIHAAIACDDEDWLQWTADAGDLVRLVVRSDPALVTTLFDPSGSEVIPTEDGSFFATQSGTYQARVSSSSELLGVDYVAFLDVRATRPCSDDGFEPNNSRGAASALPPGGAWADLCPGDTDWWSFDVLAGQRLDQVLQPISPSATTLLPDGRLTATLYDPSNTEVGETAPVTGRYTARITLDANLDETAGVRYQLRPPSSDCGDDDFEDNDARARATDAVTPFAATAVVCTADEDWYAIDAVAGDRLEVAYASDNDDLLVDVFAGTTPVVPAFAAASGSLDITVPSTGTTYVRVRGTGAEEHGYTLVLDLDDTCVDDALEPNDSVSQSTDLLFEIPQLAQACPGDMDVFGIDVLAGDILAIELHAPADRVTATVLDASSNFLGDATSEPFLWTASSDTRVHVRTAWQSTTLLGGISPADSVPYTVTAARVEPCVPDGFEPNQLAVDAAPLVPGVHGDLTLCEVSQDEIGGDWFAVDLDAGDVLEATVRFVHAEGDVDLLLYDADGALLDWSATTEDEESLLWVAGQAETVLVRVQLWSERDRVQIGAVYDLVIDVD